MKKPSQSVNFLLSGMGTMFAAMVIVGFGLGYLLDSIFDTRPWLMIGTGLLGLIGGFFRMNEMLKQVSELQEKILKEKEEQ